MRKPAETVWDCRAGGRCPNRQIPHARCIVVVENADEYSRQHDRYVQESFAQFGLAFSVNRIGARVENITPAYCSRFESAF